MAETLLSFGVQKLWDLLVRESERFKGVNEQLNELKDDLMWLKSFLKDVDAKKHEMEMVKSCVEQIKEIILDAEDIIETFILKEELRRTNGIKKHMRRLSCITVDRREVALAMEGISRRISKVIQHMKSFGLRQITVQGGEYSHHVQERQREKQKTFSNDNEKDFVGLDKKVKILVDYLVKVGSSQMAAITGMGGIGKTTLARQVFNDKKMRKHFSGFAWVCISQEFDRKDVWKTIYKRLSPRYDEKIVSNMTEDDLQEKLFPLLETSNSLIVLDDVWKEEDWDRIKDVFPSKKGGKVILTSRNKKVASYADSTCFILNGECLDSEESWTLFQKIVFPTKETTGDEYEIMEKLGKQMIEHCGGLPLAIKVLGGLLAVRHTLSEWKSVFENIKSHIVGGISFSDRNIKSVYYILHLSFEELPDYLKQCFLYLAQFPEDYTIDVGMLSYLWAAEGIRRPRYYDKATFRELADEYIEELVNRNMVISERDELTSRFETCHLHDMMREVCLLKAEEKNFVHILDKSASTPTSQSPYKSRRLVLGSDPLPIINMNGCIKNPKLRSLLDIRRDSHYLGISFRGLKLIRILDLSYVLFTGWKLPFSVGKLIHLRYFSLRNAYVSPLPFSMWNLKKLLYLNLDVSTGMIFIPNLSEMRELEYLALPRNILDNRKMKLGNLVNLVTLKNFSTKNNSVKDLHQMKKLKTLSITYNGGCKMETLSSTLSKLRHVEDLSIIEEGFDHTTDRAFVLECNDGNHLTQLYLSVLCMPKLPTEQHFPSDLTTIHLKRCCLKEDPMPILEKLSDLREVTLGMDSFCGQKMTCSGGGFPKLQKLTLCELYEWDEWKVEEGSMPLLHILLIDECRKFKQLPDALQFITSLKNLKLSNRAQDTVEEWKKKLSEGGEDHYKVQHIPHVEII